MDILEKMDPIYLALMGTSAFMALYSVTLVFKSRVAEQSLICFGLALLWFDQASHLPKFYFIAILLATTLAIGYNQYRHWAVSLLGLNFSVPFLLHIVISSQNQEVAIYEPRIFALSFLISTLSATFFATNWLEKKYFRNNRLPEVFSAIGLLKKKFFPENRRIV